MINNSKKPLESKGIWHFSCMVVEIWNMAGLGILVYTTIISWKGTQKNSYLCYTTFNEIVTDVCAIPYGNKIRSENFMSNPFIIF